MFNTVDDGQPSAVLPNSTTEPITRCKETDEGKGKPYARTDDRVKYDLNTCRIHLFEFYFLRWRISGAFATWYANLVFGMARFESGIVFGGCGDGARTYTTQWCQTNEPRNYTRWRCQLCARKTIETITTWHSPFPVRYVCVCLHSVLLLSSAFVLRRSIFFSSRFAFENE